MNVDKILKVGLQAQMNMKNLKKKKKGLLNCVCGRSNNVSKALMSPQVRSKKENVDLEKNNFYKNLQKKIRELK